MGADLPRGPRSWVTLGGMRIRVTLAAVLLTVSCAPGDDTGGPDDAGGPRPPDGFEIEAVTTGLDRPTQMIEGPDGRLWVAQLAGDEDAGVGEVVAVDLDSGDQEVLLDGLDKPTGLAVAAGSVWVVQRDSVVRAPLRGSSEVGEPEVVLGGLPSNGRSLGTMTPTRRGTLLFNTTGALDGTEVVDGSGQLWELEPQRPGAAEPVAHGLQNAYAHTTDADGRVWLTDIHAGDYNETEAPDEVNLLRDGADYGWPQCIGDRAPVEEFHGTLERCAETERPVAVLEAGATPTGVAVSPFADNELFVALWGTGELVTVDVTGGPGDQPADPEGFMGGLARPQDVLVRDGTLLLSDHEKGVVYELSGKES